MFAISLATASVTGCLGLAGWVPTDIAHAMQEFDSLEWESHPPSPNSVPFKITGTALYLPEDILRGGPHSVSSQLEGLFISMLSLSCDGKLFGRQDSNRVSLQSWAAMRGGAFRRDTLGEEGAIADHLKAFIHDLHDLFYPPCTNNAGGRYHCLGVTTKMFQAVCGRHKYGVHA